MTTRSYFNRICELVEEGSTISQACKTVGIYSQDFYTKISAKQKLYLSQLRISTKFISNKYNATSDYEVYKNLHDYFTLTEHTDY